MKTFLFLLASCFQTDEKPTDILLGFFSYKDETGSITAYELRPDSTFTHLWSDGCQPILIHGRWSVDADTIILNGDKADLSLHQVKMLEGIIDTRILNCIDGPYTLVTESNGTFVKDKKLNRETK